MGTINESKHAGVSMKENWAVYLKFTIYGFQQYSCRVGIAHRYN
jgi:hypothetical protein